MFWANLVELCNQKSTTPTTMVNDLGIAVGSVTRWKNGSVPRDTTLKKIADYVGITVDELLADCTPSKKEEAPADTPETHFMETVRGLSAEEFRELENYLNYILSKRRKED